MIWDTVIRSDVDAGQVARATKLFVGGRGPFMYRNPYPYSQSHFTDPRLVASMMGYNKESTMFNYVGADPTVHPDIDDVIKQDIIAPGTTDAADLLATDAADLLATATSSVPAANIVDKILAAEKAKAGIPTWLLLGGGALVAYFLFFRK